MNNKKWGQLWWVGGLTAVAFLLRWLYLGQQSLWLDELFSVFLVQKGWRGVIAGTAQDILPPLYYLLLKGMMQFGQNAVAARTLSVLASVLSVPVFYQLGKRLFDERYALVATAVFALNPFHILYAQEARMYTLFGLFSLLSARYFWDGWHTGRKKAWTLFTITTILAFYTHSLAFLNLLALTAFALTQRPKWKQNWRPWLTTHFVIGVAFLPWVWVILQQTSRLGGEFAGGSQSPVVLLTAVYIFLFGGTAPPLFASVNLTVMVALIAFGLLGIRYHNREKSASLWFAFFMVVIPVGGLYLISLRQPIFVERRLLPASFGLYLLLAWVIASVKPRRLIQLFGLLLGLGMFASLPGYYRDPNLQKIPMHDVAQAVLPQFETGDTIIHLTDTSALAFAFYEPDLPNHFLAGDPDYLAKTNRGRAQRIAGLQPKAAESVLVGQNRLWLIVTLDHEIAYQQARVTDFDAQFARIDHQVVGGVNIVLYDLNKTD
jgi:mannosyltransferase